MRYYLNGMQNRRVAGAGPRGLRQTMPHSGSLTLKIARKNDFATPVRVLFGLALLAAVLSPRPYLTFCMVILACIAGCAVDILRFTKVKPECSTVTILPEGQIRLESSNKDTSGGALVGQQWSTRYISVLRVELGDGTRYLPILSSQQHTNDYRRLLLWLRQDFCRGASNSRVPDA